MSPSPAPNIDVCPFTQDEIFKRRNQINNGDLIEVTIWDLNNFSGKFAGGFERDFLSSTPEILLKPHTTFSDSNQESIARSPKYLEQNHQDFFDAIDLATTTCGLRLGDIEDLNRQITTATDIRTSRRLAIELNKLVLPVYQRLREEGYFHDELIL